MNLSLYLPFLPLFNTLPRPPSSPLSRNYRISGNSGPTLSYPFSKPSNLPLSSALNDLPSPSLSLSLSLSMLSILKEAGQADNLAVLLLVGRSLAFYMLKATVRQPFSPLYTSSPPPSTLVLLDLSFSIRPRPCFAPHRPTTATDPPSRTGGFSSSNTSFDFYRLFSFQVYTLLLFQLSRCYGIQRTAIYEFDRKHDDYARPIGVFLCTKER